MREQITTVLEDWLDQEVKDSRDGHNQVLDDFETTRRDYLLSRDDGANRDARKQADHHHRFKRLIGMVKTDPSYLMDDFGAGKIVHHSLMFVSGGFRTQSFLEAGSQDDYERLRFESGRSHGIDLELTVGQALDLFMPSTAGVLDYSLALNDSMDADHSSIGRWFARNPGRAMDALSPNEPPVLAMLRKQRAAVAVATGNILLSAELRGGLENVPLLEPKSISSVTGPIYPFAD